MLRPGSPSCTRLLYIRDVEWERTASQSNPVPCSAFLVGQKVRDSGLKPSVLSLGRAFGNRRTVGDSGSIFFL